MENCGICRSHGGQKQTRKYQHEYVTQLKFVFTFGRFQGFRANEIARIRAAVPSGGSKIYTVLPRYKNAQNASAWRFRGRYIYTSDIYVLWFNLFLSVSRYALEVPRCGTQWLLVSEW